VSLKLSYLSWKVNQRREETPERTPRQRSHRGPDSLSDPMAYKFDSLPVDRGSELKSTFEDVLPELTKRLLENNSSRGVSKLTGAVLLMAVMDEVVGKSLRRTTAIDILSDPFLFSDGHQPAGMKRLRALRDFMDSYVTPPERHLQFKDVKQIQECLLGSMAANWTVETYGDYAHLVWEVKCVKCDMTFYPSEMFCYVDENQTAKTIEFLYRPDANSTDMSLVYGDGWGINVWRGYACHHVMRTEDFPWEPGALVAEATGGDVLGASREYTSASEIFASLEKGGVGLGKYRDDEPSFSEFFGISEPLFGMRKISFSDTRPGAKGFGLRLEVYITPELRPWGADFGKLDGVEGFEFLHLEPASGGHHLPLYSSMKEWQALGYRYAELEIDNSQDYSGQIGTGYLITDSSLEDVIFAVAGEGWLCLGMTDLGCCGVFGQWYRLIFYAARTCCW